MEKKPKKIFLKINQFRVKTFFYKLKFQIIKGKNEKNWREKLSLFDKFSGLRGYKEIEYLNLYLNNNTSIESFFIEENDNFFFMPYVKKKYQYQDLKFIMILKVLTVILDQLQIVTKKNF